MAKAPILARHARPGQGRALLALATEDRNGALLTTEVDHAPWPLQPARATCAQSTLAAAASFTLPAAPSHLLFARFLDVRI